MQSRAPNGVNAALDQQPRSPTPAGAANRRNLMRLGHQVRHEWVNSVVNQLRLMLQRQPLLHRPLSWLNRRIVAFISNLFFLVFYDCLRTLFFLSSRFGPAHGWYSAYQLIRRGDPRLEGRIVLEAQGAPVVGADSILARCGRNQHLEQPWPIFWSRHHNARLLGSSLVHINEQKQLCVEAAYGPGRVKSDPAYHCCGARSPLRLEGPWTSLVSKWVPMNRVSPYAHWLLEALPRLALLHEFPSETRILVPPHRSRYQVESLNFMGLRERSRLTTENHLIIEDYYFSTQPTMICCYSPYAVDFLRSSFLALAGSAPATPLRFFVRRTGSWRNIVNEVEVLTFFQKAGWSVVDTAAIGFKEQVQLFARAEAVCGVHGSGLANIVWCRRGSKVIELFADRYLGSDQEWISECIGVEYYPLIFGSDYKFNAMVDLGRLRRLLSSLRLI